MVVLTIQNRDLTIKDYAMLWGFNHQRQVPRGPRVHVYRGIFWAPRIFHTKSIIYGDRMREEYTHHIIPLKP